VSFDRAALAAAVARHGRVVRVVVAETAGSVPREAGAAMVVWTDGQDGTIGGGALEWEAAAAARELLSAGRTARVLRQALGPDLGQCCGGRVTLVTEVWDAATLPPEGVEVVARPLVPGDPQPLSVKRLLARARNGQGITRPVLVDGWLVEPVARPRRAVWVWGAGHVGRAIVAVLAPLPDLSLTWVDTAANRFPAAVPDGVTVLPDADPARRMAESPPDADHLILTYSHALDLALCHAALAHGFGSCGLIGSATKWARFRSRLAGLGHAPAAIARIRCPIGDPSLGKHPQAIAIGVAAEVLARADAGVSQMRADG
jgi:xanthine dehydrogenase accessory factor